MPVGQACKSFLVTLLTEEMIPSLLKFIWAWDWPQANYLTVGLIGRYLVIFCYFIPEVTLFFAHVFQCVWINIYSFGQDQLTCYSNPLGDAEDTLYTLLLKGEGTAICVSPRDDFTPLSRVCCQWVCR